MILLCFEGLAAQLHYRRGVFFSFFGFLVILSHKSVLYCKHMQMQLALLCGIHPSYVYDLKLPSTTLQSIPELKHMCF